MWTRGPWATGCPITDLQRPLALALARRERKQTLLWVYQAAQMGGGSRFSHALKTGLSLSPSLVSLHIINRTWGSRNTGITGTRNILTVLLISLYTITTFPISLSKLLKGAEEPPKLSRAAKQGVSTWVARWLSHVIAGSGEFAHTDYIAVKILKDYRVTAQITSSSLATFASHHTWVTARSTEKKWDEAWTYTHTPLWTRRGDSVPVHVILTSYL